MDQTPADPQSWNLYAYVRNNPLVYIDPTGFCQVLAEAEGPVSVDDLCQSNDQLAMNAQARQELQRSEGTVLEAYLDTGGVLTVGTGHAVRSEDNISLGQTISPAQAEQLLGQDIANAEQGVRTLVGGLPLSQNEFNALTDLVFNVGTAKLGPANSPNLNEAIRGGDYEGISDNLRYTMDAAGNTQRGLAIRSEHRRDVFRGGITYGPNASIDPRSILPTPLR